jgi:class 3 adenylate cyclase
VWPLIDRLFIGRECAGIEPDRRLLVDEANVSRVHAELRWDAATSQAYVVDVSTNGTRVNGRRIERVSPVPLQSGDQILVGTTILEYRSSPSSPAAQVPERLTVKDVSLARMAMVVGDIVQYSTISEYTDAGRLTASLDRIYGTLFQLLVGYGGTLNNYVGDAFFAIWEIEHSPDAVGLATAFALEAAAQLRDLAGTLDIRGPDGSPVRMGWAVAQGLVGVSTMTGQLVTVLGDATNLAFRISGLAARDGRGEVLVTGDVRKVVSDRFRFEQPEEVFVKGRTAPVQIYSAHQL